MSIESWKEEFYPVEAAEIATSLSTDCDLIRHSIIKWTGYLPQNVKAHGLTASDFDQDEMGLIPNGTSCALCQRFCDDCFTIEVIDSERSRECPYQKEYGTCGESSVDPYTLTIDSYYEVDGATLPDAGIMIAALEHILTIEEMKNVY